MYPLIRLAVDTPAEPGARCALLKRGLRLFISADSISRAISSLPVRSQVMSAIIDLISISLAEVLLERWVLTRWLRLRLFPHIDYISAFFIMEVVYARIFRNPSASPCQGPGAVSPLSVLDQAAFQLPSFSSSSSRSLTVARASPEALCLPFISIPRSLHRFPRL
jgi:hypothetical protein